MESLHDLRLIHPPHSIIILAIVKHSSNRNDRITMETSPTSPSSYLAAQRLPIISRPTDGAAIVDTATQSFWSTTSGIAMVPPATLASAPLATASAGPTTMTAILPSSSSVGSGQHGVVVTGGNNSTAANNAVAYHVTPEMIKQPILLTFSAADSGGQQQHHNGTQGSPHHLIRAVPSTSAAATSSAAAPFSKGKQEQQCRSIAVSFDQNNTGKCRLTASNLVSFSLVLPLLIPIGSQSASNDSRLSSSRTTTTTWRHRREALQHGLNFSLHIRLISDVHQYGIASYEPTEDDHFDPQEIAPEDEFFCVRRVVSSTEQVRPSTS